MVNLGINPISLEQGRRAYRTNPHSQSHFEWLQIEKAESHAEPRRSRRLNLNPLLFSAHSASPRAYLPPGISTESGRRIIRPLDTFGPKVGPGLNRQAQPGIAVHGEGCGTWSQFLQNGKTLATQAPNQLFCCGTAFGVKLTHQTARTLAYQRFRYLCQIYGEHFRCDPVLNGWKSDIQNNPG